MRKTALGHYGRRQKREKGAALVVAVLALAILTIIGIALMLITSTESRIAANEWSVNRAFYSADAGIRWSAIQMAQPAPFMIRNEFVPNFGTVLFQMPSHDRCERQDRRPGRFGGADEIQLRVNSRPSGATLRSGRLEGGRCQQGPISVAYEVRSMGRKRVGKTFPSNQRLSRDSRLASAGKAAVGPWSARGGLAPGDHGFAARKRRWNGFCFFVMAARRGRDRDLLKANTGAAANVLSSGPPHSHGQ